MTRNNSIFWAFKPIYITSKIFGVAPYNVQQTSKRITPKRQNKMLDILYIFLYGSLIYIYAFIITRNHKNDSIFIKAQLILSQGFLCLTLIINFLNSTNMFKSIIHTMTLIHHYDMFENKMKESSYSNSRRVFLIYLILKFVWFLFMTILFLIFFPLQISLLILKLTFIVDSIVECQIIFILFTIKEKLNEIMISLSNGQNNNVWNNLLEILKKYYFYRDMCKKTENAYYLHVICKFLLIFLMETFSSYYCLQLLRKALDGSESYQILFSMVLWLLMSFIQTSAIICICELISWKVKLVFIFISFFCSVSYFLECFYT